MSPDPTWTGIIFAVGAAVAWAGMDVIRKDLAARVPSMVLLFGLVAGQTPMFALWAVVHSEPVDLRAYWAPGLATLTINLVANLAFIRALEIGSLSRTIPMLSLTPAITIATGATLLGEWPTALEATGIGCVVAGTVLVAFARSGADIRLEPGSGLMLSVAGLWSLSAALDKIALQAMTVPGHGLIQSCGMLLGLSILLAAQRRGPGAERFRPVLGRMAIAAGVMAVASSLQYTAIERTLVSVVETLKRAVGAGVALAVGRWAFGEPVGAQSIAGAVCVVVGTTLIFWPR